MPGILLLPLIAFLYLTLQIAVFGKMILFNLAVPHIYIMFLIMLPPRINLTLSLCIAFIYGILFDIFTSAAPTGVGSFSAVLLIGFRELWIPLSVPGIYYTAREDLDLRTLPFNQFLIFILPLIFLHQFFYYLLDAFGWDNFGFTLLRIFSGTLYSSVFCLIISVFFYSERRK